MSLRKSASSKKSQSKDKSQFRKDFKGCQLSHSLPINFEPDVEYMNRYKLDGTWYMSEKYDGIRAIWTGNELITRSLRKFEYVPEWFCEILKEHRTPLDGEIYIPHEDFSQVSSLSIAKKCERIDEKWKKVNYLIFDIPCQDLTFEKRLKYMKTLDFDCDYITVINFEEVKFPKEFYKVNERFRKIVELKGEGVMLIKGDSMYEQAKRTKHSLKYKKEHEGQAVIISLHEGLGKYQGKLGKFKCRLPNGNTFFCGTGFDDDMREKYKFNKTVCLSVDENTPNVGDTIKFSCLELIENTGIPRLGVYKK